MTPLYSKDTIEAHRNEMPLWQQEAFHQFVSILLNKESPYPCIPAIQGYQLGHHRYGFLGDPRKPETYEEMDSLFQQYSACSKEAGPYTALVFMFETPDDLIENYSIEDYESLFWAVLNGVSKLDEKDWPEHVSKDPMNPSWEFCFDGEPYFCFCATPAHVKRKSRHTPFFTIGFQPRFVFANINDNTAYGRKLKKLIRQHLLDYDDVPIHPELKWYGQEDNLEWKQYFLRDDETSASKCPFHRFQKGMERFKK